MRIDLGAKKTEAQWGETIDAFWKSVIPRWFDWLEWVLILGVISYAARQTHSVALSVVTAFSYVGMLFYLQSVFFSLQFHGVPLVASERGRRIVSILISTALSLGVWLLLTNLISQLEGRL